MAGVVDALDRFKQPEYTGTNRCFACTVVNTAITLVLAGVLGAVGGVVGGPLVGVGLAVAMLVVGFASIYFRGYLVPKTPYLTKKYFPPWLMELFGKSPMPDSVARAAGARVSSDDQQSSGQSTPSYVGSNAPKPPDPDEDPVYSPSDLDAEEILVEEGILAECEDRDDLCLDEEFAREWHAQMKVTRETNVERDRLLDVFDLPEGELTFKEFDDSFQVKHDNIVVGRWESHPAFIGDVAAAEVLQEWVDMWSDIKVEDRGELLNGLRLFIQYCPGCDNEVAFELETVESCCSMVEVGAVSCDECGARLFESAPVGTVD